MAKTGYALTVRMTQNEVDAGGADSISGTRIEIIDSATGLPTGKIYESGATGATPVQVGGGSSGASKKLTLAGAGAVALSHNIHAGAEVHAEAGITSCTMTAVNFQSSSAFIFGSFWLFNYTGITLPITISGFSGGVSEDGYTANDIGGTGTLVNIPHTMKALIVYDADGWVRATILGSEVTQAELDLKAPLASPTFTGTPTGITKAHVGLGSADNTADTAKPVSTAQQTAINTKLNAGVTVGMDGSGYPTATVARIFTLSGYVFNINQIIPSAFSGVDINGLSVGDTLSGQYIANTLNTSITNEVTCWFGVVEDALTKAVKAKFVNSGNNVNITLTEAAYWNTDILVNAGWTVTGGEPTGKIASTIASSNGSQAYGLEALSIRFDPLATSTATGLMSSTDKSKLSGIAQSATQNDTDANLKARANHTGTQAQSTVDNLTTDLAGKSATTHAHSGTYEPANTNIQSHISSTHPALSSTTPVMDGTAAVGTGATSARADHVHGSDTSKAGTAVATVSVNGLMAATDKTKLDGVATGATANIVNNTLTSTSTAEALSAAQGKVLQDGKQATLVSGQNISSVNGLSLLGGGDITMAADLPGGTLTPVTDEGLATTGAPVIDTTTVPGQTIIRWNGAGSFTVPIGVTNVRALLVGGGGGGGGGEGVSAGDGGGGGGAGELLDQSSFVVVPGATLALSVGGGGAGANSLGGQTGTNGTNGTNSTFGTLTARGGGGGGGNDLAANTGGSGGGGGGRCSSGIDLTGGASTAVSPGVGFAGGAGTGVCTNRDGAGGGGAGGVGGSSSGTGSAGIAGTGGAAVTSNITGAIVTYAGGGGGGIGGGQGTVGAGGSANTVTVGGVGGAADGVGTVGAANTGSGGGGGGARNGEGQPSGGAGGSGIIIIRFATQTRNYIALQSYVDNAAAKAAGKLIGQFFKLTSTNAVMQVV